MMRGRTITSGGSIGRAATSGGVAVSGSRAGARVMTVASSASRVGSRSMTMAAVISGARIRARARARSVASSGLLKVTNASVSNSLSCHLNVDVKALDNLTLTVIHRILSSFRGFEGNKSKAWRISSDPDIDNFAKFLKTGIEIFLRCVGNIANVDPTRCSDVI